MLVLLRSRGRLRCLLAMALLAWLMLAVAPFGPLARVAPVHSMSALAIQASHDAMAMSAAGCCGDQGAQSGQHDTHDCQCALPCTGVLPSTPAGPADAPTVATRYAPPRPIEAPLAGFAPPLRPPLA